MPQLNPAPWFLIIIFSWLVFLVVVLPLTSLHTDPNAPAPQNAQPEVTPPWHWEWGRTSSTNL
nr:ATP synthase F0 subunit 8 [Lophogobius cyprinoides]